MPSKYDKVRLNRMQDRRSKVTDEQVLKMRKLYEAGTTQKAIATMYGISQSAVCYIVSQKAREHLKEYRKSNPPKRRTAEEMRIYVKDLRKYKKEIAKKEAMNNGEND